MPPITPHKFYVGIDPGSSGAFALLNAAGTLVRVWDMPSSDGDIILADTRKIFCEIGMLPDVFIGLEFPQPWPGAFNNVIRDAQNFGRQLGTLETLAFVSGMPYCRIDPKLWTGRLGLTGKTDPGAVPARANVCKTMFPAHYHLLLGPRGGIKDGRVDALLIAEVMRRIAGSALEAAVDQHGRGSAEAQAAILQMGPGRRRGRRRRKGV